MSASNRVFFGDPTVQATAEVLGQEVKDGQVITRFRFGRLTITGTHSRPSDAAMAAFAESLANDALEAAERPRRTRRKRNKSGAA